jgi:hypothetical protein
VWRIEERIMVKRITDLTNKQKKAMDGWADKWIEIGLRTGAADRPKFEKAAEDCYKAAGLPWHKRVVWVSSPLVMAIAAPVASLVIEINKRGAVGDAVGGAVYGAVYGVVYGTVHGAVGDAVGGTAGGAVGKVIKLAWHKYIGGQFWVGSHWWGGASASFFREVCGLELSDGLWEKAKAYEATMESACWWYPHRDFVMVCERPTKIHRELTNPNTPRGLGSHRLHNENGAAVAFSDGWGVYSIHGVQIPFAQRHIVESPEKITVAEIETETNAEVRRIMIDRYGAARYINNSDTIIVHTLADDCEIQGLRSAKLLRKDVLNDESIVYVDLLNSTPEPDGTVKRYMLRVDPNAYGGEASKNAHAAAASTWRNADGSLTYKRWQDYQPHAES